MEFDPNRPVEPVAEFAAYRSAHAAPSTLPASGAPHLPSRAEITARRARERAGVPFTLEADGIVVTVRLLSLFERTTIQGLPTELQEMLLREFRKQQRGVRADTVSEMIAAIADNERSTDMICCAGFVSPRLVMTEAELDGSDECWLVTDVHRSDRLRYSRLATGEDKEELAKIRRFLRSGRVAGLETAGTDGSVSAAQTAV